jgi:hypothetical protein
MHSARPAFGPRPSTVGLAHSQGAGLIHKQRKKTAGRKQKKRKKKGEGTKAS